MKKVLFIHGFASSGKSAKAKDLQQILNCDVIAPDLSHQPLKDIQTLEQILSSEPIEMIVGSSLGGFYALILALRHKKKILLINPSLTPEITLQDQLGWVESFKGGGFDWTVQQLTEIKQLAEEIQPNLLQQHDDVFNQCLVLLAQKDERLDSNIALSWLEKAKIIVDMQQDHRFEDIQQHRAAIQDFYVL